MAFYRDGKLVVDELPIEKNIPIPKAAPNMERTSPLYETARSMVVGDSVVIPHDRAHPYTSNMTRATGFKFTQRIVVIDGVKMLRIWRTK